MGSSPVDVLIQEDIWTQTYTEGTRWEEREKMVSTSQGMREATRNWEGEQSRPFLRGFRVSMALLTLRFQTSVPQN